MILELDAGNTRIKWRLRDSNGWSKVAEGFVNAREKLPSVFIELGTQLEKLPMKSINRTFVANVRGEGFKNAFSALMTEKWHLQPEFATATKYCRGVTNGYSDFETLGVDRWLAMLEAYNRERGACCIVDFGTTITVDIVDGDGKHVGGYLVPGVQLLKDSLAIRSEALETETVELASTAPGRATKYAVHNGILRYALGLVRDIRLESERLGIRYKWFFTGGDATTLLPHCDWSIEHDPDLVLDGLELAMLSEADYENRE